MRTVPECHHAALALPVAEPRDGRVCVHSGEDGASLRASAAAAVPHQLCATRRGRDEGIPAAHAAVGIRTGVGRLTDGNAGIPTTGQPPGSARAHIGCGDSKLARRAGGNRRPGWRGHLRTAIWITAAAWFAGAMAATPDIGEALASNIQSAAEQAVREHFGMPGDRIEVAALALNPRLRLGACALPLRASVADFAKAVSLVTALVQCPQPGSWSVRVPVRMQLFRGVLVSTHPLLRGDGVRAGDVRIEQRDVTRLGYGYIDNIEYVAGRTLARPLAANSVLTPEALGGRRMIRAGDHVEMIARLGGIVVRANGIALGSGDSGARLRVRNTESGKIVDGIVQAPGQVIALP